MLTQQQTLKEEHHDTTTTYGGGGRAFSKLGGGKILCPSRSFYFRTVREKGIVSGKETK
ncbi:hypothetical protein DEO72_LG11g897 [Vigna unguiculata]|uniref:Uncharacterized protein n=1 Tax=Vigna unguiculata TaxID=3917 RepID=A0A4D6NMW3_VIGUN|nr:hypothetical protein DEO72_LG11g897 [Vigna unguiculata]